MLTGRPHFRIFLSSPGDVPDERALAHKVLMALPYQPFIRNQATIEVVAWDTPGAPSPLYANVTPQEVIHRWLPKPSECDLVVVILWSKMGTPLPEEHKKPDGSRYVSGTEWEYEDARKSGRPLLVYRRTEEVIGDLRDAAIDEKLAQFRLVEAFFVRFRNPDGSLNGAPIPYGTPGEFKQRFENDVKIILESLLTNIPDRPRSDSLIPDFHRSPYPGLRAFTENEASYFFGRDHETDALLKRLGDPSLRFLAVVGASGSGKSSLIGAGVLPRLRDGALAGSKQWLYLRFSPSDFGEDPFLALASQLAPPLNARPRAIADRLFHNPAHAGEFCLSALKNHPQSAELVLFIDQLEELFGVPVQYRLLFDTALGSIAAERRLRILCTIRADLFPRLTEWPQLTELLHAGNYLLLPPGWQALTQMVVQPAERAGIQLETGLADRIVKDTSFEPGALPLLAYTLEQLYTANKERSRLTFAAYEAIGGIRGAIAERAEASFQALGVEDQAALPQLFRGLVSIDAAGIATRRRAVRTVLTGNSAAGRIIGELVQARLLIADSRESEDTIEVAHEALFQSWPRLKAWVEQSREFLLWRQRLRFFLEHWNRTERKEEGLLHGALLEEALGWLNRRTEELTGEERRYILWTKTDDYQIEKTTADAATLLHHAKSEAQVAWHIVSLLIIPRSELPEVARRIQNPDLQTNALSKVAQILLSTGRLRESLGMVTEISDPKRRRETLSAITEACISTGDLDGAFQAVRVGSALQVNASVKARLVDALVSAGRLDEAIECALTIDFQQSAESLIVAAQKLVAAGDLQNAYAFATRARAPAARIADRSQRTRALIAVARELVATRCEGEAREVIAEALRETEESIDPLQGTSLLGDLVDVLNAIGEPEQAIIAARRIQEPRPQAEALIRSEQRLVLDGKFDRAKAIDLEVVGFLGGFPETSYIAELHTDIIAEYQPIAGLTKTLEVSLQLLYPWRATDTLIEVLEAFVSKGKFDLARRTASHIRQSVGTVEEVVKAAHYLAVRGMFEWAEEIICWIGEGSLRGEGQIQLAHSLALTGDVHQAIRVADEIPETGGRVQTLARVSTALLSAGRRQDAALMAIEAQRQADSIEEPRRRYEALIGIVQPLVSSGLAAESAAALDAARDAAMLIERVAGRRDALMKVLQTAAFSGHGLVANRIAAEVLQMTALDEKRSYRTGILTESVEALVFAGDLAGAAKIAREALEMARRISARGFRIEALIEVSQALSLAGQNSLSIQAALEIADPQVRDDRIMRLARTFASAGKAGDALHAIHQIEDSRRRTGALMEVAQSLSAAGLFDNAGIVASDALRAAGQLPESSARLEALGQAIRILVESGSLDAAADAVAKNREYGSLKETAIRVAEALMAAGDVAKGIELVTGLMTSDGRTDLLVKTVKALIDARKLPAAMDAAELLLDEKSRFAMFTLISRAMAAGRELTESLRVLRRIDNSEWRTQGLIEVAQSLISEGCCDGASDLITEASLSAEGIDDYDLKGRYYSQIAKLLSLCHRFEAARITAEKCHLPTERLGAYTAMLCSFTLQRSPEMKSLLEGYL